MRCRKRKTNAPVLLHSMGKFDSSCFNHLTRNFGGKLTYDEQLYLKRDNRLLNLVMKDSFVELCCIYSVELLLCFEGFNSLKRQYKSEIYPKQDNFGSHGYNSKGTFCALEDVD